MPPALATNAAGVLVSLRSSLRQPPRVTGHSSCPRAVMRAWEAVAVAMISMSCVPRQAPEPVALPEAPEPSLRAQSTTRAVEPAVIETETQRNAPALQPSFAALPVPGHGDAVVSVPPDTRTPRPVLVAAHGAGDKPSWQCHVWQSIIGNRGFVLCPRGTRMSWGIPGEDLGYFFRNHHALEAELLAVLEAFEQRFGHRVAPGPVVYAGYSQGGIMGALATVQHPSVFQRLILIEGGEAEWDVPTATRFRKGGGKRVLFVCGRHACNERARRSSWWLKRGGVDVRRELVQGGGHTYGGRMAERLAETFDWVVQGDERWHADTSASR